ncbi:hypothetical protein O3G_MSEX010225 [Manduca sexta]|uniref:CRAL-TRIO domain-containing protein n=1 Tax=Manduca sexta TaxID=7130 RepID=A0A921ZGE2_MANSE|nr:hypothetical protein O3G_MSEX010225 [Manduca sexta]
MMEKRLRLVFIGSCISVDAVLPDLTEDHYRVYVGRFLSERTTSNILMECYRHGILVSEYIKAHDYCNGFVAVIDYRLTNMVDLIAAADFIALHHFITILMEGYGMRIKGIHALTSSKAIETLLKIVKKMFGPKVSNRIHVHMNIESLYEHLPKKILPSDLGGDQESLEFISGQWNEILGTKENINYMKEMSKAVSNEAYRLKEKLNGVDLGLSGTFRSLNVD